LDGQPAGTVTPAERAEAARLLAASTQRGQTKATRVRVHREREEQRRQQREHERRHREAKAARKAEYERYSSPIQVVEFLNILPRINKIGFPNF
jgi:sRNA-binding protein